MNNLKHCFVIKLKDKFITQFGDLLFLVEILLYPHFNYNKNGLFLF